MKRKFQYIDEHQDMNAEEMYLYLKQLCIEDLQKCKYVTEYVFIASKFELVLKECKIDESKFFSDVSKSFPVFKRIN